MTSFGEQWAASAQRHEARVMLRMVLWPTAMGFAFGAFLKPLARAVGYGIPTVYGHPIGPFGWPWWANALWFGVPMFFLFAWVVGSAARKMEHARECGRAPPAGRTPRADRPGPASRRCLDPFSLPGAPDARARTAAVRSAVADLQRRLAARTREG
jgi:hypothetical protein